ncbi:MAG TPA: hypothetical protein PLF63_04050 [Rubrivivax sp.]|jgi:hypothetical protein|nr:hypothetical protein [Rubrivivax sp.]
MSLALMAAIIIELERRKLERVSVSELAAYTGVAARDVTAVLLDIHNQGHCVLYAAGPVAVAAAQWLETPACA